MKLTLKILKLFTLLILTVSIFLFSASFLLQDKVAGIMLESLNKNISTKLDVRSFKLSFLRKFPSASLELIDVVVHSSSGFNSTAFPGINTDTLLVARFVSIEFKITDVVNGTYNIKRIRAKSGRLNFFTDLAGKVNYDISFKNKSSGNEDFTINLEKINLSEIKVYYNNLGIKLITNGLIKNGQLKSRISGDIIDFTAVSDLKISGVQLYNTKITKSIDAGLDLTLQRTKNGFLFKKSTLTVEKSEFSIEGSISSENFLDLNVSGNNIDISNIRNYLPEKYQKLVSEYDPSGLMVVKSSIKGLLNRTNNPHVEISGSLKNGRIAYGKSKLTINDLSFQGFFTNGTKNSTETSIARITNLKAKLGTSEYTGSVVLRQFKDPITEISLKGKVFPGELKEFFNIESLSSDSGSADIDLKLIGSLKLPEKITFGYFINLNPEINLTFNSLNIGIKHDSILLNEITGDLFVGNTIKASGLKMVYKGERIKIDGEFRNLPEWLDGRPVQMIATADVSFDKLAPEIFFNFSPASENPSEKKTSFRLPQNLLLNLNFKIDSLNYKTFFPTKIEGSLTYKPSLLTFTSINMKALGGTISGNGFIFQNGNKSLVTKGSFNVTSIDVNKTFSTFNNFGQTFLKSENIRGLLSGSLTLLLPLDSLFKPQIKSLTAEGKYILTNGSLVNFDPVKQLATFIELSELKNIGFKELENDFFIRNNFLYIPQMDVKSSAADLSVNGKHSFDNDYEYHIKILLSEVLSKKRKKNKSNVSEFGVIEDDGLGRTSLLLKITGKGEDIKVGYDVKAVSTKVKNNIKSERQSLKTILNQEYGWYKKDSVPIQKPIEKKTRFKITWDETDSLKAKPDL
jgi:hypothetical protein